MRVVFACPILLYIADHTITTSHRPEGIPEGDTCPLGSLTLCMEQGKNGGHGAKLSALLPATVRYSHQQYIGSREAGSHVADGLLHTSPVPTILKDAVVGYIQSIL